jgi:hypothetical protein
MSTNSTQKSLLLPAQGDFPSTWGVEVTSGTFTPIDACFGAQVAITLSSSDHTITTSETQAPIHNLSGTLSGDVNVVYPASAGGFYIVENATSGAHTVTAKYSGGTGVVVPQTSRAFIKSDPSETAVKFAAIPDLLTTRGDFVTRSATTYSRLAVGTANQVLITNGTDPSWGQVSLSAGVTGTLPIANGGSGQTTASAAFNALAPTTTQGDIIYYNGASTNTRLAAGTSGKFLQTKGSSSNPTWTSAIVSVTKQVFVAGGTYTPTTGMLYCVIECVGGGGGGGGSANSSSGQYGAGGGGGGGGYSRLVASAATIGSSQTVTIGAGGTAGTSGNHDGGAGGDTSVGTLCIGKGGSAGGGAAANSSGSGGAGGVAGTGDFSVPGQDGMPGGLNTGGAVNTLKFPVSGNGGNSLLGFGAVQGAAQSAGGAGNNYGGGGGGGRSSGAGGAVTGGAGAGGIVIITEYIGGT